MSLVKELWLYLWKAHQLPEQLVKFAYHVLLRESEDA